MIFAPIILIYIIMDATREIRHLFLIYEKGFSKITLKMDLINLPHRPAVAGR